MNTPLYVGIDLGTTNSTAAVFDGESMTLIRNAQGTTLTPSVVRIDARRNVTVGAKARRFLETDPENTRAEFKRLMGTSEPLAFAAANLKRRPEELAAEVLRSLRTDVKEQLGVLPERAVISVPALFELPQCAAVSESARLAGFAQVELIQEPVASAIASGWSAAESTGAWLVYDLGGGTFDASLLETRDGLLRVVGHDGDNFLGGRDFDWAIVEWVLEQIAASEGVKLSRSDPALSGAMRRLKAAAEEAKIELTRERETSIAVPQLFQRNPFQHDGGAIDVDVTLTRARLEEICAPLIARSIEVCRRLLAAHACKPGDLECIVLVGGPTMMPLLRSHVREALGAPFGEGLDPMTLVAQGAAIYAATAALDARPQGGAEQHGRKVWLQYPAMSSDLNPHVVGRVAEGGGEQPERVRLMRADGLWNSDEIPVGPDGGFVASVSLIARRSNLFRLEGIGAGGRTVKLSPATITIVQGLTVSDPPLSRSIGIALADDTVRLYFERGAPLPVRRTFAHYTVESVSKGSGDCVLRIPVVQGELERAHLCRLVGMMEIPAGALMASLPAGALVEVTLELDRGGRLAARAHIPQLKQVFENVVQLLVPEADPETLAATLEATGKRITTLRAEAFRLGDAKPITALAEAELTLRSIARDVEAAKGGDADAAQRARRALQELEATLDDIEAGRRWPELEAEARGVIAWALNRHYRV